jgi:hypothetical protein
MVALKRRWKVTYKVKAKITLELKYFSNGGVGWALREVERWGKMKEWIEWNGRAWTCRWDLGGKKQFPLFWGSQKGALFFQMKKDYSY